MFVLSIIKLTLVYETIGLLWHYNAVFTRKSQLTERTVVKSA